MRILSCLEDEDDDEDELAKNEGNNRELCGNDVNTAGSCALSFTPQQAHIFGGQSIFLSFVNINTPLNEDIFYYVVFKGSKLQHITSAKVLNPYTLQAVIPDHNVAELVILSIYQYSKELSDLSPDANIMATDTFVYTSDSSQFLTQQLALNVDNSPYLLNLQNVYSSLLDISVQDKKSLDYKLTTSFRNLSLPPNWSLVSKTKKDEKSWTLFHFCAKYNFTQLAEYLLTKPGAKEALKTFDEWDRSPIDISNLTKHKKMSEILSRTPRIEELAEKCEKEKENPTVKRHKLGTTTFTSNVSREKDITMKDVAVLMEYDALASSSKGLPRNGAIEMVEEIAPLAQSLKKLYEIKDEIQRLRSINSQESFDRLDAVEESFGADMVLNNSIDMLNESTDSCNGEHLVDENMNERDIKLIDATGVGEKEIKQCEITLEEEKAELCDLNDNDSEISGDVDVSDINFSIYVQDDEKPPKLEMQLSNISVNTVDVQVAENIAAVCEEPVQNASVVEFVQCVVTNDHVLGETVVVEDVGDPDNGELSYKLESVTEETEEELSAAGTGNARLKLNKEGHGTNVPETSSLNELPPLPNKRVGALRKSVTKKDRPLSDSFENLRMVEKQGIVDFYMATSVTRDDSGQELHRGHSLDTLTKNIDNDNDNEWSSTSVNECHGSQESVSSDSEYLRDRTDSGKSIGSQRTRSLLSLTDLLLIPRNSSEERLSKKSSSFIHRLSFKKAKSLTSLDMREEKNTSKNDERRKTVQGNIDEFDGERIHDPHHGRSDSYDENIMKKSKSSVTISKHLKGNSHEHSDEDTDEGTSHEIGEQHPAERKSSHEDKQKGIFSILRTGSKGSKEKKHKKQKLATTNKQEPIVPSKSDLNKKSSQKRGGSFRHNIKQVADSSSEKLSRSTSVITNNNPFANKRLSENRKSDRKSPSLSNKFNAQILEVPEGTHDSGDSTVQPVNKNLSSSQTSLNSDSLILDDDTDSVPFTPLPEVEFDPDLDKHEYDEVESWSELVDKKVQKRLTSKDIKRQDVIFELIKTEAQYVRILYIMKKIYHDGMKRHLNYTSDILNAMFPVLDDLIELNSNFLRDMKFEQIEVSENLFVKRIGNILLKHFNGENGRNFRDKYGYFCSHHLEAVALYKEFLKSDKKFQSFNKSVSASERTSRLSVQDCITCVTVRITKYPLLIEAIIKATKDVNPDYADLKESLSLVKGVLSGVDEDVEAHEQEKELENLKKNLDKNVVEIKNEATKGIYRSFKANKLFHKHSRLLYDKKIILKSKTKNYDTRMVILADKIIFFQENGGKLHLLNVDNKLPVMSLKGVMVRENAADSKALFLMNKSEERVELYEIIFEKHKEKEEFMPKLDKFISNCPDEEEENITDNEEEARKEEERMKRIKRLVDYLETINREIQSHLEAKNKAVHELIEITDEDGCVKVGSPSSEMKPVDVYNTKLQLEEFLSQVNAIIHSCSMTNNSPASSPSQGNQNSNSHAGTTKKADTFGGFDNRSKPNNVNNIQRGTSLQPRLRPSASDTDKDTKQRRQSQFMQVLSRTKTMGSNEDISSLSSASSTSLSNFVPPSLSEMQVYQHLSVGLGSLVEVTNQQDLEMARMRCDLQEARALQLKTEAELSDIKEKLTRHQKDSERQLRIEKENYARLTRELKRSKEKSLKLEEQHIKSNSEEMLV